MTAHQRRAVQAPRVVLIKREEWHSAGGRPRCFAVVQQVRQRQQVVAVPEQVREVGLVLGGRRAQSCSCGAVCGCIRAQRFSSVQREREEASPL